MLRNSLLQQFFNLMGLNLPRLETMDEYIDFILPRIKFTSKRIKNSSYFQNIRWLQVSDQDEDTTAVIHIFSPIFHPAEIKTGKVAGGATYIYGENGNLARGTWTTVKKTGSVILKYKFGDKNVYRLHELAFLDSNFFILKKHFNPQKPLVGSKYIFLARERYIKRSDYVIPWDDAKDYDYVLPWRDIIELLYNTYRLNSVYLVSILVIVFVFLIVVFLSI